MRICTAKFIFLDTPQKKEKNELDRKEKKLCALGLISPSDYSTAGDGVVGKCLHKQNLVL